MSRLNAQLARAVDQRDHDRLAISAHEIGHALTWLAAGIPINDVRLKFGMLGGFAGGFCDTAQSPTRDDPRSVRVGYLVGIVGGHAAQVRFCRLYLGMDPRKAYRRSREWAEGDYLNYPHWRSKLGLGGWSWSGGPSADEAFERASELLELQHRRLDELTLRLDRAKYLPGGAL